MNSAAETLLITLSGEDRPGVTAAVFAALSAHDAEVLDIEQIVARGHLTLAVLLDVTRCDLAAIRASMADVGADTGLDVRCSRVAGCSVTLTPLCRFNMWASLE